jgi:hypothetical protein
MWQFSWDFRFDLVLEKLWTGSMTRGPVAVVSTWWTRSKGVVEVHRSSVAQPLALAGACHGGVEDGEWDTAVSVMPSVETGRQWWSSVTALNCCGGWSLTCGSSGAWNITETAWGGSGGRGDCRRWQKMGSRGTEVTGRRSDTVVAVLSSSGRRYAQGREEKEGYLSAAHTGGALRLLFIVRWQGGRRTRCNRRRWWIPSLLDGFGRGKEAPVSINGGEG